MELSAGPMYYKEEMENNLIPGNSLEIRTRISE